jgi:hypothetical protein
MIRVSRSVTVVVAAVAAVGSTACQTLTKVSVLNRCGRTIEAEISDVADPVAQGYDLDWTSIPAGERARLGKTTDPVKKVFVWVRTEGSGIVPAPVQFDRSDLQFPADEKRSAIVSIAGDLCPS